MKKQLADPRFVFLYLVISAFVVGVAMTYSFVADLGAWQTVLLLLGGLIGGWATLFTLLEVRRIAKTPKYLADEALEQEPNPYGPRKVIVKPPTGDPCVHHEDYPESAGLTEEQLLFRIADPTPIIEEYLTRRAKKKQQAAAH